MIKNMRFTLEPGTWYACEIIGDEFEKDKCSYSPIKIYRVTPKNDGSRTFTLEFYHANYPSGVRDKAYKLRTIERGRTFMLAKSIDGSGRILQIYDIDSDWIWRHLNVSVQSNRCTQDWLDKNV